MSARTKARMHRAGEHGDSAADWPCPHCGGERVLVVISALVGIARRKREPAGLVEEVERLRLRCTGPDQWVSACTGCAWMTTDILGR